MLQSSILPKLLAKENITIQHGNYHTAWFDVEKRILGLPMWKDMGKDVYDLLVGHEVSHALHTPFEGWHDSPEKLEGAPRSYLNVVEDARIERFIQNIYPGLVGPMARGYKVLKAEGFFGDVDDLDWDQVKLIDKLNIKAKLAHLATVPFTPEEKVFLDRMMTTQTFEEVVQLAKDILTYTKENQPELLEPKPQPEQDSDGIPEDDNDDIPQGHDDMEPQSTEGFEKQEEETEGDSDSADEEDSDDRKEDNDSSSSSDEEETSSADDDALEGDAQNSTISDQPTYSEEDVSRTDEALRRSESRLLDKDESGNQPVLINDVSKETRNTVVIPFNKLSESRKHYTDFTDSKYKGYKEYIKATRKAVNFAVKEFEQRKAAFQYTRATTAKTGRIDVNKLWSYKTSEDIFSQVTRLADAKNHGMLMLVDFSGSMCNSMPYVMDQLLHLVLFCKQVNIPFDVYGFTSTNPDLREGRGIRKDGDLHLNGLSMPLICSSSLKKKDYESALLHMYGRKNSSYYWESLSPYEDFGSTPLDQSLFVCHHLIKEFKIKHGVQKMNFVTFTDGDSNGIGAIQSRKLEDKKLETNNYTSGYKAIIDGKMLDLGKRFGCTKRLLSNISKRYNTKTIGFFMADNAGHWRDRLYSMRRDMQNGEYDWEDTDNFKKEAAQEYRRNKCVSKQDVFGYDQYYLLKGGKTLSAEDEEFETFGTETDSQLRAAFKKHSKGKKLNKVLMTSFGKEVA